MKEMIIKQAKAWGFKCEFDKHEKYQILPQNHQERWKLQIADEGRWLLIVGDVPQMLCFSSEVIKFLERRRYTKNTSTVSSSRSN
jgi:hypothetical protein